VGAIDEIGFTQRPKKLNDGSGKTNYPGTIDIGFTVFINKLGLLSMLMDRTLPNHWRENLKLYIN
jgi:hypothetical protein